jgi:hypothetical protein
MNEELMSSDKVGAVDCNYKFFGYRSNKWCGYGGYYSTKGTEIYCPINCANKELGIALNESLFKSIHLRYSKEIEDFLREDGKKNAEEQFQYLQQKYGYKTKNDMYKNMMSCSLDLSDGRLKISPMKRKSPGAWNGLGDEYDIIVQSDALSDIIGAAVRFAFTRCQGKGRDVVVKALFPDGEPNSLEEYLASVNPDYQKWLISG